MCVCVCVCVCVFVFVSLCEREREFVCVSLCLLPAGQLPYQDRLLVNEILCTLVDTGEIAR